MSTYQLATRGTGHEISFSLATVLNALEIPFPEAEGRTTLNATEIRFDRGMMHTKWLPAGEARITLANMELEPPMAQRLLFRWRLRPAAPKAEPAGESPITR